MTTFFVCFGRQLLSRTSHYISVSTLPDRTAPLSAYLEPSLRRPVAPTLLGSPGLVVKSPAQESIIGYGNHKRYEDAKDLIRF